MRHPSLRTECATADVRTPNHNGAQIVFPFESIAETLKKRAFSPRARFETERAPFRARRRAWSCSMRWVMTSSTPSAVALTSLRSAARTVRVSRRRTAVGAKFSVHPPDVSRPLHSIWRARFPQDDHRLDGRCVRR